MSNRVLIPLIVVALVGLAPSAAAGSEAVADEAQFQGPSRFDAKADMLHLGNSTDGQISGKMGSVYGFYFTAAQITPGAAGAGPGVDDVRTCPYRIPFQEPCQVIEEIGTRAEPLVKASLSAKIPTESAMQVFPWGGDMVVRAHATLLDVENSPMASMGGGQWGDPVVAQPGQVVRTPNDATSGFTERAMDDWTIVATSARPGTLHLQGDFVLEIRGPILSLAAGGDRQTIDTSTRYQYTDLVSDPSVQIEERTTGFLRLYVTDGDLNLRGLDRGAVSWAAAAMDVVLEGGSVDLGQCLGACSALQGTDAMRLEAGPDGLLARDARAATTDPASNAILAMPTPIMLAWILGAAFVVVVSVFAWRAARVPGMAQIEAALGAGQYPRAARLATRLLRREPRQESAQLSRAVAWSRAGHPQRVVRALTPYLRRHEPSDGTIHYVLGLAHKDLGHQEEARRLMAEAVHRTPGLLAEIDPDLRPSAQAADAHAYT